MMQFQAPARALAAAAIAFWAAGSACHANPTTTAEVGDVADFLFQKATCKDFNDALGKVSSGQQTTREILITTLGVTYIEGYAAGAGNSAARRADLILRCTLHPDQPFNTVLPGK